MLVEGKGVVAPAPVRERLSKSEVAYLREVAAKRASFRNYSNRGDAWGRGFREDAIFVGLVGEYASCRFIKRRSGLDVSIDESLKDNGDGGQDLVIGDLIIQIKTRVRGAMNRIRRVDDRSRVRELNCDVFLFSQWNEKESTVLLLGWISADDARQQDHRRSPMRKAKHWNLEFGDEPLEPMSRLIQMFPTKRSA